MFSFLIFCKYYRIVTYVTCLLYHATITCQGYYPDFFSSYYIHFFTFFTKFYNQLLQKYYIYKLKVDKWNIFYYSNYSNNYHYRGGYRMATLKYSRQRASIKEYLDHTTEHPTADTVYLHVREEFPRISLGTVYRNLNLLADMGEAIKITTPDGGDRFDGNTHPHYHVVCTCCNRVFDLHIDEAHINTMNKLAEEHFDGTIDSHATLFYGTCQDCLTQKTSRES